jgi:hypothetical protein
MLIKEETTLIGKYVYTNEKLINLVDKRLAMVLVEVKIDKGLIPLVEFIWGDEVFT